MLQKCWSWEILELFENQARKEAISIPRCNFQSCVVLHRFDEMKEPDPKYGELLCVSLQRPWAAAQRTVAAVVLMGSSSFCKECGCRGIASAVHLRKKA